MFIARNEIRPSGPLSDINMRASVPHRATALQPLHPTSVVYVYQQRSDAAA